MSDEISIDSVHNLRLLLDDYSVRIAALEGRFTETPRNLNPLQPGTIHIGLGSQSLITISHLLDVHVHPEATYEKILAAFDGIRANARREAEKERDAWKARADKAEHALYAAGAHVTLPAVAMPGAEITVDTQGAWVPKSDLDAAIARAAEEERTCQEWRTAGHKLERERDDERKHANEWLTQLHDMIKERDAAVARKEAAEIHELRALRRHNAILKIAHDPGTPENARVIVLDVLERAEAMTAPAPAKPQGETGAKDWRESSGIPRRNCIDKNTPVELAIRNAMRAVEESVADPRMTDAVMLLEQSLNKVADVEDERIRALAGGGK